MGAQDVGGCTWVPHLASHPGTHLATSHKDEPRMLPELQWLRAMIGSHELGARRVGRYTVRIGLSVRWGPKLNTPCFY